MWSEKLSDMHKDPTNCLFHIIAAVIIAYGLWINSIEVILGGLLFAVIGHIVEELKKKKRSMKKSKKTKKKKRRKKKAALEMSIGTIVIIVIAVTMLILGIVFVRSTICSGIIMSEEISRGMRDEIRGLFSGDEYGVRCMGQGSEEPVLGTGGRRAVHCIIRVEDNIEYDIDVKQIESLRGASTQTVQNWVLREGWEGSVAPGGDGKDVKVLILDIPKDAPTTTLDITLESTNSQSGTKETHDVVIDIKPTNFFTGTMC
jgi:hypothetical protein